MLYHGELGINIFIVATYGDGEPPDGVLGFTNWLHTLREPLSNLNYSVCIESLLVLLTLDQSFTIALSETYFLLSINLIIALTSPTLMKF